MARFTRKHFDAYADMIRKAKISPKAKHELATEAIHRFGLDNPRFDVIRFLEACQLPKLKKET